MLVLKGSADDQVDVIFGVLNRHVQGGGGFKPLNLFQNDPKVPLSDK